MIPEGNYLARGMSISEGESKVKKTLGVTVVFSITQDSGQKGQMIEWNGYWSDKTKERTAQSLVLCGYNDEVSGSIGKNEVLLVIEHEEIPPDPTSPPAPGTPPRKRAKVSWVNDPLRGSSGMEPIEGATREQFRAELRAVMAAKREEMNRKAAASDSSFNYGANGGQAPPPPPPAPPPAPAKAPPRF